MNKRTKLYVEFPIAKTLKEAIEFMEKGGGVWQECSDDFPNCGGFDSVDCLKENFPEEEWDYLEDNQDLFLHLVPDGKEDEEAEPFRVGETVWAKEKFFITNDLYMHAGDSHKIVEISDDGKSIKLDVPKKEKKNTMWPADKFCRCVLAVLSKKIYILSDFDNINLFGFVENHPAYETLEYLKQDCVGNILWSDECEDLEEELEKLGIADSYVSSNSAIDGIDKETGKVLYGIEQSELLSQCS